MSDLMKEALGRDEENVKPISVVKDGREIVVDDKAFYKRNEKGQFGHGNKGKLKGVGSIGEIRKLLRAFTLEKAEELWDLWDHLNTKDKVDLLVKIVRMTVPIETEDNTDTEITINLVEAKPKKADDK